ncbi:MAG: hypothetical protein CVU05_15515 [Bacteroidetes bacterium HGW-Bacteroidetes-21]|jgi:hypothetical protein|nr:MAG: hypothetical protein CVU05_15515 [Bacteroidetes bacterium HGW-Bacteroidetes-21]
MRSLLITLTAIVILSGCATDLVYMNVQEPAPITIPSNIKAVGVINRSAPLKESKIMDGIDQVLSLETKNLDKDGSAECVSNLNVELQKNTRFSSVKMLNVTMKTSGAGIFPAPITWDSVGILCKQNGVDALFVLELFDTDSKISYATHSTTVKTPLGDIPAIEHEATMKTLVKGGFRIYDGTNKTIISEYTMNRDHVASGRGINPVAAASALVGRKEAVKQIGGNMGIDYAQLILPYWINVTRDYYVKGTDNFKTAKRKAQSGNWDGAAELWKKETDNSKAKVAGRACYNMAIINEINGNLDDAIGWAQKSYEDYGNRLALSYVNVLRNRKARIDKLNRQQGQ